MQFSEAAAASNTHFSNNLDEEKKVKFYRKFITLQFLARKANICVTPYFSTIFPHLKLHSAEDVPIQQIQISNRWQFFRDFWTPPATLGSNRFSTKILREFSRFLPRIAFNGEN